jgi:hypothetical protein
MIKDSGERTQFESGAQRDCQEGKGRMDLLPYRALMAVSKIFEEGAKKYDANNWRKGIPLSRYADSGQRHFAKWMVGMRDEPHLEQACWNLLCLIETSALIEEGQLPAELNDLPYHTIEQKTNPLGVPPLKFPGCLTDKCESSLQSEPQGKMSVEEWLRAGPLVGLAIYNPTEDVKGSDYQ